MLNHDTPATRPAPAPGSAAEAFLSAYGFNCPVYKATLTATGCEANRNRPADERKPGCGPECTVYLEKRGTWSRRTPETPAWLLVKSITGCNSFAALAESMGRKRDNGEIGRIFADLERGRLPRGAVWNALLKFTKLNGSKLLNAGKAAVEQQPGECVNLGGENTPRLGTPEGPSTTGITLAPVESSPASVDAPAASSPPTPSGPAVPSPAAPEGPAGHMMAMQDAPDSASGLGTERAEQLFDSEESPAKVQCDPNVGDYVRLGENIPRILHDGTTAPELPLLSQHLLDAAKIAAEGAALPDDFLPYTGGNRAMISSSPALNVKVTGDVELSAGAVREFGLLDVRRVRLHWSAARGQVGIVTMDEAGPGVLTLQNGRGPLRKRIAARAFFRCFGVNPAPGTYPMERHPSGLLVATITQQPAQTGGEA